VPPAACHVLVSFRNLSEITKIDPATGAVLRRLGGLRNEFAFLDALTPHIVRQHSVRAADPLALPARRLVPYPSRTDAALLRASSTFGWSSGSALRQSSANRR
jgi:hypothetical protein